MAQVEWSLIDHSRRAALAEGDLVSFEAGGLPIYEVVSISDGRAWLRETQTGRDHVLPAQSLRWRMQRPAAAVV